MGLGSILIAVVKFLLKSLLIHRFITKLDSIGVVYRYSDDMLDEFMRLESVAAQMKREPKETVGRHG